MKALPPRITLLVILAMFSIPLVLAWLMNSGSIKYQSGATVNLGTLVSPVVPLDWSSVQPVAHVSASSLFNGFWVILYAVPSVCNAECLEQVTQLRQVHRASGKNQNRIRIALLLEPSLSQGQIDELLAVDTQFNLVADASKATHTALAQASSGTSSTGGLSTVYLLDPLGNIMMTYNGENSPHSLSKDLKRLLTWSTLDKHS